MEIARLWEEVERKRNLLAALGRASRTSRSLQLIADTLDQLRQSHEDCKGKLRGEFAKRLSLAAGVWAAPARLVEDLRSIMQLVAGIGPAGFGAVQLMTMRKAKGLDADVVVMVGLEDDIIPSPASSQEEQARLFYVSMTRAREKLYLLHSYKRPRNISFGPEITKKKRSRFLESLGRPSRYLRSAAPTS